MRTHMTGSVLPHGQEKSAVGPECPAWNLDDARTTKATGPKGGLEIGHLSASKSSNDALASLCGLLLPGGRSQGRHMRSHHR